MKSRTLTCIAAMTLFAPLALLIGPRLAAQEQHAHNKELPRYAVTDVFTLGGSSEAVGVNNRGLISGSSKLPGDLVTHGFFWQKGVITDLGTLGGPNSFAPEEWPASERGEVAGFSDTSILDPNNENFCSPFSFLQSDPYICLPFVWRDGVMTPLPTLGGNNGAAVAINNRGQLTGIAETTTADPACLPPQVFDFAAVIWGPKEGEIHKLPPLTGDNEAVPTGINDNGQVVGTSANCAVGPIPIHAVLWEDGKPTNLGSFGGAVFNIAFGINNQGKIVGGSDLAGDTTFHAFFWQKGVMTDLGTLPGDFASNALSINNKTQVVGISLDASGNVRPFLWHDGVITDLNTLIPADSPLFLLEALGINDRGQIVGYAFDTITGEIEGYLVTPVSGSNAAPGRGGTNKRQDVILPESARKLLRQRMAQRWHIRGVGTPRNLGIH